MIQPYDFYVEWRWANSINFIRYYSFKLIFATHKRHVSNNHFLLDFLKSIQYFHYNKMEEIPNQEISTDNQDKENNVLTLEGLF